MKRKPNKPRPESQTHTEPGGGAAEPGGSAFGAGSEQEPGRLALRDKVSQSQNFGRKASRNRRRHPSSAWKSGAKNGKPPGKSWQSRSRPNKKARSVRRRGAAGWGVHGFVHGKLYEVEQENVGTEGAHRSELAGEVILRHGSRFVKRKVREHPARAASRAEARYQKAAADYHFHTAAQEHPELSKTILPGTGRNSGLEGNTRSGRRRPQNRAQKPPGKQPPPRKS